MKKLVIVILALMVAGTAMAGKIDDPNNATPRVGGQMELNRDGVLNFENFVAAEGFVFYLMDPDPLIGDVTTVIGDFQMLFDTADWTYCNDLTLLVANADLSVVLLQVGGWNSTGATHEFGWLIGDSSSAGPGGGTVDLGMSLDVTGYYLFLGNGYAYATTGGEWTGSITLMGSVVSNEDTTMSAVKALYR